MDDAPKLVLLVLEVSVSVGDLDWQPLVYAPLCSKHARAGFLACDRWTEGKDETEWDILAAFLI